MLSVLLLSLFTMAQSPALSETFEGFKASTWPQGSLQGPWVHEYHGYGQVGVKVDTAGNKVLFQKPKASKSPDETHASLVLSQQNYKTPMITYRSKVIQQLRTPKPFPWETAWIVWNYTHDHSFYYFAFKTNGWELGKVDNTKANPHGPECLWPEYLNCKYEGAQRYLRTANAPKVKINQWANVKVQQTQNTLSVYVGTQLITQFTDNENPYYSGQIGLYNEDAHVHFDNIKVSANP